MEKGWLKNYIEDLKNSDKAVLNLKKGRDPEHSLYHLLQPTGFMYGRPVGITPGSKSAAPAVTLIDTLFKTAIVFDPSFNQITDDWVQEILESIRDYYSELYEASVGGKNWFGKTRNLEEIIEKIAEKRIQAITSSKKNFWSSIYKQSLLFIDVYIFGQWRHTRPDSVLKEFFKNEKEELIFNALKVMAAAAHANAHIAENERKLFKQFIDNADLPSEKRRVAWEYFTHGIAIQDIPIDSTDPWSIKKYYLELGVLTVWSDHKIDQAEKQFLEKLYSSMGLETQEFEKSVIAVQSFLLGNWETLEVINKRQDFDTLKDDFIDRFKQQVENYASRFENAIRANSDLMMLLLQASKADLSQEEEEKVNDALLNELRQLPPFRAILLPKTFFTYANTVRILPKGIVKSLHN